MFFLFFFNDAIKLGIWTVWEDFMKQLCHFVHCILPQKCSYYSLTTHNPVHPDIRGTGIAQHYANLNKVSVIIFMQTYLCKLGLNQKMFSTHSTY